MTSSQFIHYTTCRRSFSTVYCSTQHRRTDCITNNATCDSSNYFKTDVAYTP